MCAPGHGGEDVCCRSIPLPRLASRLIKPCLINCLPDKRTPAVSFPSWRRPGHVTTTSDQATHRVVRSPCGPWDIYFLLILLFSLYPILYLYVPQPYHSVIVSITQSPDSIIVSMTWQWHCITVNVVSATLSQAWFRSAVINMTRRLGTYFPA
jgi:hypothetical protein